MRDITIHSVITVIYWPSNLISHAFTIYIILLFCVYEFQTD